MHTKQGKLEASGVVLEGVGFVLASVTLILVLLFPVASAAGYLP